MPEAPFTVDSLAKAMDGVTDEVKREMGGLIDQAAQAMLNRVQQRYPSGPTGNLRGMVYIKTTTSSVASIPTKKVRAMAPHLWMWQNGTKVREDATRKGANRGRMPAGGPVFETAASEVRANMLRRAQALLDRNREL